MSSVAIGVNVTLGVGETWATGVIDLPPNKGTITNIITRTKAAAATTIPEIFSIAPKFNERSLEDFPPLLPMRLLLLMLLDLLPELPNTIHSSRQLNNLLTTDIITKFSH